MDFGQGLAGLITYMRTDSPRMAPEAVDAGPIAFVKTGDPIILDVANRTLEVEIDDDELESRKVGWAPLPPKYTSGVLAKYRKLVSSAAEGAVTG